jgi:stage III sporulation protein AG
MKGKWTLLLLGIAGVALLLFGGTAGAGGGTSATDSEDYRLTLTAEVRALCREVSGVGEVSVLLTLEEGERYEYARSNSGYVTAGGSGLLLSTCPPRVAGVAVVCTGGGDPAVQEQLRELLSAALGIGAHKVKVSAKK